MDRVQMSNIVAEIIGEGRTYASVALVCDVDPSLVSKWAAPTSAETPGPERLAMLLDFCEATPEQRRRAWEARGVPPTDLAPVVPLEPR